MTTAVGCLESFEFLGRPFFCCLDKGHHGEHVTPDGCRFTKGQAGRSGRARRILHESLWYLGMPGLLIGQITQDAMTVATGASLVALYALVRQS